MKPVSIKHAGTGIERSHIVDFGKEGKALVKTSTFGSADSEFMVYEFSESIGWGIVPETIKIGQDVTMQRWVEGRVAAEGVFTPKSDRIVVMDALLGNTDRHQSNYIIDDRTNKQWAIDNNQAFRVSRQMQGEPIKYMYGAATISFFTESKRVPKDRVGLLDAAKDVRRWFKTPAYSDYVAKLEKTHGKAVARQFSLNVADLVDWSRKAKVME